MPKITIHTATYNRAYILPQAYESLKLQSSNDFEWIITDDGSSDNTEKLVEEWKKEDNGFPIIYNKLTHVGIPRALNSGVNLASAEWFMMLDSDDYFLPETIEKAIVWLDEITDNPNYVGIGFGKCTPDGKYMGKGKTPKIDPKIGYVDATNIERKKYDLDIEMCEVTRVELLKKYPFVYWKTEAYAPEQINYNQIAMAGFKYRWHPECLNVCEYQPDGQTRDNRIVKNNPMGFAMMYNQNLLFHEDFKSKFNDAMQMNALSFCSGNPSYILKSNNIGYSVLALLPGAALSVRRKMQFKKMG